MKKLGILFATVIMAMLFVVSASALEPTGQCGDNVYWEYDSTTGELVISGEGEMFNYYFDNSPFTNSYDIKHVIIEVGITSIGDNVFLSCYNLESVVIPNSVTQIGDDAFMACYNLSSINIPKSVVSIEASSFRYCPLTNIKVDENNGYYSNDERGVLFNKDKTELILYPAGNLKEEYNIPHSVVKIYEYAFYRCENLKTIYIPDSVIEIKEISYYLGSMTFYGCDNLNNIVVDKNNKYYSNDEYGVLFDKDKLSLIRYPAGNTRTEYSIPDSVINIGDFSFESCSFLTNIVIPNSVVSIGIRAFEWCYNLTAIIISSSVIEIDEDAFNDCKSLSNIIVDKNNNYYSSDEYGALFDKDKTKLIQYPVGNTRKEYKIPKGVTTIDDSAFYSCDSLVDITIPNSVTNISSWAFASCRNLIKLYIPNSVTSIGGYAFYCSDKITDVYYSGSKEQWNNIVIKGYNNPLIDAAIRYDYCLVGEGNIHSYKTVVTPPTCTTQGYTTYTCECGDTYIADYVYAKGHTYTSYVTDPTCTAQGLKVNICSCGDNYTETLPAKGHTFNGSVCTTCGYDKADTCSCNCHKSGLSALLWKILSIFYKLLRINKACVCGISHY